MTIETMVIESNKSINYIDAICDFCESKDIEVESVVKLIAPALKEKIKQKQQDLTTSRKNKRCTTYLIMNSLKFILYVALKTHFSRKTYDYFKYNGTVKVSVKNIKT